MISKQFSNNHVEIQFSVVLCICHRGQIVWPEGHGATNAVDDSRQAVRLCHGAEQARVDKAAKSWTSS